jgi:hypothetical protein
MHFMQDLKGRIRELTVNERPPLPLPGGGRTPARHRALAEWGRTDLSMARIGEGHADALAILAEAGHTPRRRALYGVWASDGPQSRLTAEPIEGSKWRLDGIKQYCSGATFVSAALVTAHFEGGLLLFDLALDDPGVRPLTSTWETPALADTATGPVSFDGAIVTSERLLGGSNWYLIRAFGTVHWGPRPVGPGARCRWSMPPPPSSGGTRIPARTSAHCLPPRGACMRYSIKRGGKSMPIQPTRQPKPA